MPHLAAEVVERFAERGFFLIGQALVIDDVQLGQDPVAVEVLQRHRYHRRREPLEHRTRQRLQRRLRHLAEVGLELELLGPLALFEHLVERLEHFLDVELVQERRPHVVQHLAGGDHVMVLGFSQQ